MWSQVQAVPFIVAVEEFRGIIDALALRSGVVVLTGKVEAQ